MVNQHFNKILGKYSESLAMYELGISNLKSCTISEESASNLKRSIVVGLSRTLLHMGDISKGMRLIANVSDANFLQECASILERLKQYSEAAGLLEKIAKWNNAAQIWVKGKKVPLSNSSEKLGSHRIYLRQNNQYQRSNTVCSRKRK